MTSTASDAANTARLDKRYGRRHTPTWVWVILGTCAAAVFAWFAWGTITNENAAVRVDDLSYAVIDDHTAEVSFQVSAPANREIACSLQALDEQHGVVGWKTELLPVSPDRVRGFRVQIPTLALATTAIADTCWIVTRAEN